MPVPLEYKREAVRTHGRVLGVGGSDWPETITVAVHGEIAGLQPGTTYHYSLVADNVNELKEPAQGMDVVFGPPLIEGESSLDVGSLTATLQAEVSPQSVDTRVRVEYGTSTQYGRKPRRSILARARPLSVCRWRWKAWRRARRIIIGLWRRTRSVKARARWWVWIVCS